MTFGSVVVILLGFFFSALFSGVETGGYMINRIRLRHLERERKRTALILSNLLRHSHLFIFTVLIGNNVAIYLLTSEVTDLYLVNGVEGVRMLLGCIPWNAETAATLTLMFPLFLFAEIGPKNLFRKRADILMYRTAGMMRLLVWLFYPLTWPLRALFRLLTRDSEQAPDSDLHRLSFDALKEFFSAGEKEGLISSHQNRMLENVTRMHRIPVRRLMTPFSKVPHLPETATVADFKRLLVRRNETHALLMRRGMVVGEVSLFALVQRNLDDAALLKTYAEDVLRIEDNRNLKSAFYRLRRNPRHRAVIIDAHRHPIGFIRLEDIARFIARK